MKITICHKSGDNPVTVGCRVYGFENKSHAIESGWIIYAVYELPDTPELAAALIDALSKYDVNYSDASFSSVVPESANMMAGLIDQAMARDEFWDIPYKSLTRQRNDDHWIEITRRMVACPGLKAT